MGADFREVAACHLGAMSDLKVLPLGFQRCLKSSDGGLELFDGLLLAADLLLQLGDGLVSVRNRFCHLYADHQGEN